MIAFRSISSVSVSVWLSRRSSTSRSTSAGGRIGATSRICSIVMGSASAMGDSSFSMIRFSVLEALSVPRSSSRLISRIRQSSSSLLMSGIELPRSQFETA